MLVGLALLVLVGCSSDPEQSPPAQESLPIEASSDAGRAVEIVVGHCSVEPVRFRGRSWAVPYRQNYMGAGGAFFRHYDDWRGTGEKQLVSSDEAVYRDSGGAEVRFRPVSYLRELEPLRACD